MHSYPDEFYINKIIVLSQSYSGEILDGNFKDSPGISFSEK